MMTVSNFPHSVDGNLCSKDIFSSLHICEIIIFPDIYLPSVPKGLYPNHRA